jgi:hypothetical protein
MKLARDITNTIEKNRGSIWGITMSQKYLIILNDNYLGVQF